MPFYRMGLVKGDVRTTTTVTLGVYLIDFLSNLGGLAVTVLGAVSVALMGH